MNINLMNFIDMKKIIFFIFCVVTYCFAIPYVQGSGYSINSSSASSTKLGFGSNVTENNMILVVGYFYEPTTVTVTDNLSNAYTLIDTITNTEGLKIGLWYADSISGGADTVTMTYTSACSYRKMVILEYNGYSTLDAHDISNRAGTLGTIIGDTITTTINDALVFSYVGINNTVIDVTANGGYIFRDSANSPNNTFGIQTCDSVLATAGDIRNIYGLPTTANYALGIASFKAMSSSCTAPTITAFATSVCTVGVAFTKTNTVANTDSVTYGSLPAGLSGTKTGAEIGKISGTPTTVSAKIGYRVIAWGCEESSKDTTYDTLSIIDTSIECITHTTKKWTTCDAEYATVREACDSAQSGDTVVVAEDTATWSSALILTKGIILLGQGITKTKIISNVSDANYSVIFYSPANEALDEPFRVSGFNIDCDLKSNGIVINSTAPTTPISKIRIDHNSVINPGGVNAGRAMAIVGGPVYGVADNNILVGTAGKKMFDFYGGNDSAGWKALPADFGDTSNFYFEDNSVSNNDTYTSSGQTGRYVLRYNTYSGAGKNFYPVFDIHGNLEFNYGAIVSEVYGNNIDMGTYEGSLVDLRGGKVLIFMNSVKTTNSFGITLRDEYANFQPSIHQEIKESYFWHNVRNRNSNYVLTAQITDDCCGIIDKNVAWREETGGITFTGDSGVGVGSISDLPATCDSGVAFWVTNQYTDTISSSALGQAPTTPLSGILYRATADNIWTRYYTPYQYPHPLRGETVTMSVSNVAPITSSSNGVNDTINGSGFGIITGYVIYTKDGLDYHAASYIEWTDTRVIVTTPILSAGEYNVLVINGNSLIDSSAIFTKSTVTVGPLSFSPYAGPSVKCRTGVIFLDSLKNDGSDWDSATVFPTLPTGITLNKTTGVVTGTTTIRSNSTLYRFYGWGNGIKQDSTDLLIRFYKPEIVIQ